jgi:DUF4097 and DUF4098 domain-containing protein YvlB
LKEDVMQPTTYDITGSLRLRVRLRSGDVQIVVAETSSATVQIADDRDHEVTVEHRVEAGGDTTIEVRQRKEGWGFRNRDVRVAISVPPGTVADVSTGSGDVRTEGALAGLTLQSGSGDATIDVVTGATMVKNASGDLRVRRADGPLTVSTASGDIDVEMVGGAFEARTASGDIQVGTAAGSTSAMSASGDLTIGAVHGDVSVRSVSGDIAIGVPAGTRVWFDVSSASGDAVSELDPDEPRGGGEAAFEIRAASVSGDIRIRRAPSRDTTAA